MRKLKTFLLALFIGLLVTGCGCEKQKFTVEFDSNGGTKISSQTVEKDGTVSKPTNPTREGYTFEGWYLNDQAYNFSTKVTTNFTLKAKWSDNSTPDSDGKFTVTFNSDGGSAVSSQKVEKDGKVSEPSKPTKDGYTFDGWYLNGDKYDFSAKVTKSITLTAKWTKKSSNNSSSSSSKKSTNSSSKKSSSSASKSQNTTKKADTPVAVTYSCQWGGQATPDNDYQYLMYIVGSDGKKYSGTINLGGVTSSVSASGTAFNKKVLGSKACSVVSVN
jgi:uncharacterized repeat protein (TIGR02543 family)